MNEKIGSTLLGIAALAAPALAIAHTAGPAAGMFGGDGNSCGLAWAMAGVSLAFGQVEFAAAFGVAGMICSSSQ